MVKKNNTEKIENSKKKPKSKKKTNRANKDMQINKSKSTNIKKYKVKTRKQKPKKVIHKDSYSEPIIIKSRTPYEDKNESKKIYDNLKKGKLVDEPIDESIGPINPIRSFSPAINRQLVSLKSIAPKNISGCENLMQVKIGKKCVSATTKQAQQKLLYNLRSSKHLDCTRFIAPKQFNSNCWFNTMFVTFFFSDKGRKFFRFLRQLMIIGEKANGEKIPQELAELFSIFNIIIDMYYNQQNNNNVKLIRNFNTNYFIENLHTILIKKYIRVYKKNESGNPIEYYKNIIKYLNYNVVNIMSIEIETTASNSFIDKMIKKQLMYNNPNINPSIVEYPEIIIVEMLDDESKTISDRELNLELIDSKGNRHNYHLDAVIIRDRDKQHFSSLLTCGGKEYSFDGASYSRLNHFGWKDYLNKRRYWGFEGHDLKWSFMSSYQMLFYYKI